MKNYRRVLNEQNQAAGCDEIYKGYPNLAAVCKTTCYEGFKPVDFRHPDTKQIVRGLTKVSKNKPYFAVVFDVNELGKGKLFYTTGQTADNIAPDPKTKPETKGIHGWGCKQISGIQTSENMLPKTDELMKKIKLLYNKGNLQYLKSDDEITSDDKATGSWKKVKVTDIPGIQEYITNESGNVNAFVWMWKEATQVQIPAGRGILVRYTNPVTEGGYGWKLGNMSDDPDNYLTVNLQEYFPNDFKAPYYIYKEKGSEAQQQLAAITRGITEKNKVDKESCKRAINDLWDWSQNPSSKKSVGILKQTKEQVQNCIEQKRGVFNFTFLKDKINDLKSITDNRYRLYAPVPTEAAGGQKVQAFESRDLRLKKLIRESLIEVREVKKKSITEERAIITNRLKFLTENIQLKTKKQQEKFAKDLLNEIIYLNKQGFNKKLINEDFFDVLKGLLGNVPGGVIDMLKEQIVVAIQEMLGIDTGSWVSQAIKVSVGNLHFGELSKLFSDCGYTSKWISENIVETFISTLMEKKGMSGGFMDTMRNVVVNSLKDSDMGQKIENAISGTVCSGFGGIKNKMDDTAAKMKEKALSAG